MERGCQDGICRESMVDKDVSGTTTPSKCSNMHENPLFLKFLLQASETDKSDPNKWLDYNGTLLNQMLMPILILETQSSEHYLKLQHGGTQHDFNQMVQVMKNAKKYRDKS